MTRFLLVPIANDPHTQGLFRVARIARRAGIDATVVPPSTPEEAMLDRVHALDPELLGLSYRLSPAIGVRELRRTLDRMSAEGLLARPSGAPRRVAVAGLPETMRAVESIAASLPCTVTTIAQGNDPLRTAARLLRFLGVPERLGEQILAALDAELNPPRIAILDELAREAIAGDRYQDEPPLGVPSAAARASYVDRIRESPMPLLRSHFGVPAPTIAPTVEGVRAIALARVVDEISLGSSDLSQRYFGRPEEFSERKNDGGVPYATVEHLRSLVGAARAGTFPALKPYAHVVDLVGFVRTCLDAGMLVGAHQAIPLFWFDELDGRGPMTVEQALSEHVAAVRELAAHGVPVEMNDPNHWASRWAHDTIVVADYALVRAVMAAAGASDLVLQLQLNKPRETGDFADLAKMTAALAIVEELAPASAARVFRETRTGIDSFDPDPARAKLQLARSTMLQMLLDPHAIHVVSTCEAVHVATPADVVDSSKLVRRAVRVFRAHGAEARRFLDDPVVVGRRDWLLGETRLLLGRIALLAHDAPAPAVPLPALAEVLSRPDVLHSALERGLLCAPGIFHARYSTAGALPTGPTEHGFIDCLDPVTGHVLQEAERLDRLDAARAK